MNDCGRMRARLLAGAAVLAMSAGAAKAADPVEIEAVTVTAQKRTQDTLDVGLNVAVVGAQELADRRVAQVSDLVAFTPNVDIKENMPGVLPVVMHYPGMGAVPPGAKGAQTRAEKDINKIAEIMVPFADAVAADSRCASSSTAIRRRLSPMRSRRPIIPMPCG